MDHAAEAVLPLALADPPVLQRAGEALLAACADGAAKVGGKCCRRSPCRRSRTLEQPLACLQPALPPTATRYHLTSTPCPSMRPQAAAQASLQALVASVGAAASLDRPSRRAFGKALSKCVTDLRGAVNVR